jgi:hypothetical protein
VAGRPAEAVDGVLVAAPHPPGRPGHVRVGHLLGVLTVSALTGEVQQFDGRRWVTVLVGNAVPVTDRRSASRLFEHTDTWATTTAGAGECIVMGFDGSGSDHVVFMRLT